MKQSAFANNRFHLAIIMDGNGRWATARGLPRTAGHRAGATAVRRVIEAAPSQGIRVLTLFAFSSDNWKRPGREVNALLRLFEIYLRGEVKACIEQGVKVEVIGRRDRLPPRLQHLIAATEQATSAGNVLHLRLAIDYSSRDAILRAAAQTPGTREDFSLALVEGGFPAPDVDLVIRTGGEQRLSDFLLWECAYAELYFTELAWPDFDAAALATAVAEFGRRQRRFGGLDAAPRITAVAS